MQPTRNTLSENIRAQSIGLLNKHLVAAIDLQAQVKQAHWNVRGPGFIAIHSRTGRSPASVRTTAKPSSVGLESSRSAPTSSDRSSRDFDTTKQTLSVLISGISGSFSRSTSFSFPMVAPRFEQKAWRPQCGCDDHDGRSGEVRRRDAASQWDCARPQSS